MCWAQSKCSKGAVIISLYLSISDQSEKEYLLALEEREAEADLTHFSSTLTVSPVLSMARRASAMFSCLLSHSNTPFIRPVTHAWVGYLNRRGPKEFL